MRLAGSRSNAQPEETGLTDDTNFSGQRVLVVGGSSGIGNGVAQAFARRGAEVHVWGTRAMAADYAGVEGSDLADLHYACVDVGDPDQIERAPQPGGDAATLDVLVLCQGTVDYKRREFERAGWDRVMAVNLRGYLAGCKYALPQMIRQGGGAIVNTASTGGFAGDISRLAYSVSKSAIIGLTRQIATHHGAQGIRCNAVAPGLVLTPGTRGAAAPVIGIMQRQLLVPEIGVPEDIAALVCFLASSEARYINGQTYIADGGMLAHNPIMADLRDLMAKPR